MVFTKTLFFQWRLSYVNYTLAPKLHKRYKNYQRFHCAQIKNKTALAEK